jgi:KUP system potassium uptake protein
MEPTIQFADAVTSTSSQGIGGVVPLRQRSHPRRASVDVSKNLELEDAEDEDAGLRDERDYKKRQV